MIKIAHMADVHIFNDTGRHNEYRIVFNKIYEKLNKIKPDKIVISGDLFENKLILSNEAKILAGEFLTNLSKISKVIITCGNHDLNFKNLNRVDSIKMIVKLLNNSNITYYNKSGIYDDSDINDLSWVVYHHPEKNIDPWKNNLKDNNKIYIGLFHDPIQNSKTDLGTIFKDKRYKNINYFKKNDFLLFGDIHKRQYFRRNKSAAYCGSTTQKDFGETIENHGFLLWQINSPSNFKVDEYNIKNEHVFVNLYIDEKTDYDNLKLIVPDYKYLKIKVHWKDLSSNINVENERKIRNYIQTNFNTTKIKFDKTYIYTDVVSSKMLSETLDLNDSVSQRKIFNEYLEEQGYKKKDITEILNIDDIINDKLELKEEKSNIEWKIDKFWFDNFKVFGDKNKVDWSNFNGIIQIHGENQQGKTTILDAITYILYGTTLTTDSSGGGKREKFGDNRYINNKRDIDKCSGGVILDIDGEKYTILRKTIRETKRNGDIKSVSTNVDYYDSDVISEKNKQTGERKSKTQKKLDMILGEFVDFVRISLTNADNLNDLLSANRSVFIDSIIRDAGYDIFEKKQKEYKEYKKEKNVERINVDINESELKISKIKEEVEFDKENIKNRKITILDYEKTLDKKNLERDNLIKKLNKIDESMISFDVVLSNDTLRNYKGKIEDSKLQIALYDREILNLPDSFDNIKLDNLKIKLKETNNKTTKIRDEISTIKSNNIELNNKSDKVKQKLRELRDKEIQKFKDEITQLEKKILDIEQQKRSIVNNKILSLKDDIKKVELEKLTLENKIKSLKKDGSVLKSRNDEKQKEIEELSGSNFCPTCGREFDESTPDHLEHIKQKTDKLISEIDINSNKIKELISEYKENNTKFPLLEENLILLKTKRDNLLNGEYNEDILNELEEVEKTNDIQLKIGKIEVLIDRLRNNDLSVNEELKSKFDKGKIILKKLETDKNDNLLVVKNLDVELKSLNIDSIEDDIYQEEKIKENYEFRKEKINIKEKLILNIDNYKLKISEIDQNITKFEQHKEQIDENKLIQSDIDKIDVVILELKSKIGDEYNTISDIKKEVALQEKEIEDINVSIKKYIKQKKQEELMKEYQRCISRDGIPTYLLKKSIHLINKEMNDLLSNVDFTLFFDENLTLKMSMDDRLDISQNTIESSGKERTFCALVLKIALRQINVKSRPNFIILDEIMGKLYEQSVMEFIELLDEIKNKIDKIIIIEHVHPINYDGLISVDKDKKLISSLSTNF